MNIGVAAELVAAATLMNLGYQVYLPFDRRGRHDLVAFKDGVWSRIQVKHAGWRKAPHTTSEYLIANSSTHGRRYTKDEIDYFAFVDDDYRVWLVPVEDLQQSMVALDKRVLSTERTWRRPDGFDAKKYRVK